MKLFFVLILTLIAGFSFSQQYAKVKIYANNDEFKELINLGLPVDHGERKENTFIITDFSASEVQVLIDNNFTFEYVIFDVKAYYAEHSKDVDGGAKNNTCSVIGGVSTLPNVPVNFYENNGYAGFYKYQDMLDALDAMVAQYPNLITVKAPISNFLTTEGMPIYFVKISDSPATDDATEPKVLHSAIHHAREPMSMSQTIFYMWYLLENYATNEEVQFLVDNTEIFFVPCINVDGYLENEANDPAGFGMHRKNKANVGTTNPGVDLNRNYSYGWNTTGVSADPNNDTYPGTSAFSEPETQAMKWLVENYGFTSAFNAHSYGQLLLYPVGTTVNEFADHHDYFGALSGHMCSENGYSPQKSSELYPASGDSDDWMYKVDIGQGMKDTVFAMTPEVGTDFWPAQAQVKPTCQAMVFPNLIVSHITHKYLVVKDIDPSMISSMTGDFNHSAFRLGFVDGAVSVSIEPLQNVQSVGAAFTHDLYLRESASGAISYVLNPAIQYGDPIVYVLNTDYGTWTYRDTITKTFGAMTLQVSDDATTTANWTGTWTTTADAAYSPTTSFTESDGGDYNNNVNKTFELIQSVDLTNATEAMVSFYAKWEIEADYDYCQFQVSTNGGTSWTGQCGNYTVEGSSSPWNGSVQPDGEPVWEGTSDWVLEEISLSDYLGQTIQVRFQMESDGGATQDGFYFDDFQISFNEPAGLTEFSFDVLTIPNPANQQAYISLSKVITDGMIQVYDQAGKLVYEVVVIEQTNKIIVPTAELPEGVYTVRVQDGMSLAKPVKLVVIH